MERNNVTNPNRPERDDSSASNEDNTLAFTQDIPVIVNMPMPDEGGERPMDETLTGDNRVASVTEDDTVAQNEVSTGVSNTEEIGLAAPELATEREEAAGADQKLMQTLSKGRRQKVPPKKSAVKRDAVTPASMPEGQTQSWPGEATNLKLPLDVVLGCRALEESKVSQRHNESAEECTSTARKHGGGTADVALRSSASSPGDSAPNSTDDTVPASVDSSLIPDNLPPSPGYTTPVCSVDLKEGLEKASIKSQLKDLRIVLVDVMHTLRSNLPDSAWVSANPEPVLQTTMTDVSEGTLGCVTSGVSGENPSANRGTAEQKQDGAEALLANTPLHSSPRRSNQKEMGDSAGGGKPMENPQQTADSQIKSVTDLAVGETYFKCRQCDRMFSSRFAAVAHICPRSLISNPAIPSRVTSSIPWMDSSLPGAVTCPLGGRSAVVDSDLGLEDSSGMPDEQASDLSLSGKPRKKVIIVKVAYPSSASTSGPSRSPDNRSAKKSQVSPRPSVSPPAQDPEMRNAGSNHDGVTTTWQPACLSPTQAPPGMLKYRCWYCNALFLSAQDVMEHTETSCPNPVVAIHDDTSVTDSKSSDGRSLGLGVVSASQSQTETPAISEPSGPVVIPASQSQTKMPAISKASGPVVIPMSQSQTKMPAISKLSGPVVIPMSQSQTKMPAISKSSGPVVIPVSQSQTKMPDISKSPGPVVIPVSQSQTKTPGISKSSGPVVIPMSQSQTKTPAVSKSSGPVVIPVSQSQTKTPGISKSSGPVVIPVTDALMSDSCSSSTSQRLSSVVISIPTSRSKSKVLTMAVPVSLPVKSKTTTVTLAGSGTAKRGCSGLKKSPAVKIFTDHNIYSPLPACDRHRIEVIQISDDNQSPVAAPTTTTSAPVKVSSLRGQMVIQAADTAGSTTPVVVKTDASSNTPLKNAPVAKSATLPTEETTSRTRMQLGTKTFTNFSVIVPDTTKKTGYSTKVIDTQPSPVLTKIDDLSLEEHLHSQCSSPPLLSGHKDSAQQAKKPWDFQCVSAPVPSRKQPGGSMNKKTVLTEPPRITVVDGKAVSTQHHNPAWQPHVFKGTVLHSSALAGLSFQCSACREKFLTVAEFAAHASLRHHSKPVVLSKIGEPGTWKQVKESPDQWRKVALTLTDVHVDSESTSLRQGMVTATIPQHKGLRPAQSQKTASVEAERETAGRGKDAATVTRQYAAALTSVRAGRESTSLQQGMKTATTPQRNWLRQAESWKTKWVGAKRESAGRRQDAATVSSRRVEQPAVAGQSRQTISPRPSTHQSPAGVLFMVKTENTNTDTKIQNAIPAQQTRVTGAPLPKQNTANRTTASPLPKQNTANRMTASPLPQQNTAKQTTASPLTNQDTTNQTTASRLPKRNTAKKTTSSPLPNQNTAKQMAAPPLWKQGTANQTTVSPLPKQNTANEMTASPLPKQITAKQTTVLPLPKQNAAKQMTVLPLPNQNTAKQTTVLPLRNQNTTNQTAVPPVPKQNTANQTIASPPPSQSLTNQRTVPPIPNQSSANRMMDSLQPERKSPKVRGAAKRKRQSSKLTAGCDGAEDTTSGTDTSRATGGKRARTGVMESAADAVEVQCVRVYTCVCVAV